MFEKQLNGDTAIAGCCTLDDFGRWLKRDQSRTRSHRSHAQLRAPLPSDFSGKGGLASANSASPSSSDGGSEVPVDRAHSSGF